MVHEWSPPASAPAAQPPCSPTPPVSTGGSGRRSPSGSSPRAAASGRSTSAATATATRPIPEGGAYQWSGFAADALAVVDHLGLAGDPALVACGHSKGAAALLLGEADRPGTYARIWAYEPIVFPSEVAGLVNNDPMANGARRRRNEWASIDEAYDAYASKPRLGVMTPESLRRTSSTDFAIAATACSS